jgi:hypothetical protein
MVQINQGRNHRRHGRGGEVNKILNIICLFGFCLSGCISTEDKILDFAGILFIIFIFIVIMQLSMDNFLSSTTYKKLWEFSARFRRIIPPIMVLPGIILILFGLFSHGLNKIFIFIGMIMVFFAGFMKQYNKNHSDDRQRSRYARLLMLCVTFSVCLIFMMTVAKDHLKF